MGARPLHIADRSLGVLSRVCRYGIAVWWSSADNPMPLIQKIVEVNCRHFGFIRDYIQVSRRHLNVESVLWCVGSRPFHIADRGPHAFIRVRRTFVNYPD